MHKRFAISPSFCSFVIFKHHMQIKISNSTQVEVQVLLEVKKEKTCKSTLIYLQTLLNASLMLRKNDYNNKLRH